MTELLTIIALVSIWNLGIQIILSDGMALENLRKWAEAKDGKIWEPLIWCVWCRPSIHSVFVILLTLVTGIIHFTWNIVILYPLIVSGASLVSGFIWSLYILIEVRTKYFTHKEQNEFFDLKDRKFNHFKNKEKIF